jgi:hypothetical protein
MTSTRQNRASSICGNRSRSSEQDRSLNPPGAEVRERQIPEDVVGFALVAGPPSGRAVRERHDDAQAILVAIVARGYETGPGSSGTSAHVQLRGRVEDRRVAARRPASSAA